jgi:hypothetical protein
MKSSVFTGCALTSYVASALLAGCGGSQLPAGVQSEMQKRSTATDGQSGAQTGDLLYVTTSTQDQLYILKYPQLQVIATIGGFSPAALHGVCRGPAGEVYVTDDGQQTSHLYLFNHGAKTPSRVLSGPGGMTACSVDSTTGDVAVTTVINRPALAIFKKGEGRPKLYELGYGAFTASAYAPDGDLYLIHGCLVLFAKGTFTCVKLAGSARLPGALGLQWHNGGFIIAAQAHGTLQNVYTVKLTSATTGRLVSEITLDRKLDEDPRYGVPALIVGNDIMAPSKRQGLLTFWNYPKGGEPLKSATLKVRGFVSGLALSPGT